MGGIRTEKYLTGHYSGPKKGLQKLGFCNTTLLLVQRVLDPVSRLKKYKIVGRDSYSKSLNISVTPMDVVKHMYSCINKNNFTSRFRKIISMFF